MRTLTIRIDTSPKPDNQGAITIEADAPGKDEVENKLTNALGHLFTHTAAKFLGNATMGFGFGKTLEDAKKDADENYRASKMAESSKIPSQ
jgi:hypothetical protein